MKTDANRYFALATHESIIEDNIKTRNGERGTKTGNGKMKNENNQRMRIEVTDGAKVQVGFCSHFSFFHFPLPVHHIMGISKQTVFVCY